MYSRDWKSQNEKHMFQENFIPHRNQFFFFFFILIRDFTTWLRIKETKCNNYLKNISFFDLNSDQTQWSLLTKWTKEKKKQWWGGRVDSNRMSQLNEIVESDVCLARTKTSSRSQWVTDRGRFPGPVALLECSLAPFKSTENTC